MGCFQASTGTGESELRPAVLGKAKEAESPARTTPPPHGPGGSTYGVRLLRKAQSKSISQMTASARPHGVPAGRSRQGRPHPLGPLHPHPPLGFRFTAGVKAVVEVGWLVSGALTLLNQRAPLPIAVPTPAVITDLFYMINKDIVKWIHCWNVLKGNKPLTLTFANVFIYVCIA